MAALTKDRNTPERSGKDFVYPVAAATRIFAGALVVLDAGVAKPGALATGLVAVGRADAHADNRLGAAGDAKVPVRTGVFRFNNSADADLIAHAAWSVEHGLANLILSDRAPQTGSGFDADRMVDFAINLVLQAVQVGPKLLQGTP